MLNFHKYEGCGNDFIMINNVDGKISLKEKDIARMCDRNFGIGADGVILLESSDKADCFMNYYNSDGSLAEMCGNGVRCTAKFFLEQTGNILPYSIKELNIDTRAGIKNIKINEDGTYSVNMGVPIFESEDFPSAIGKAYGKVSTLDIEGLNFNCVSMGNPHAVTIVEDLDNIDFKTIGSKVENNPLFPNKINVEFVEKISPARNASSIADADEDTYYKVRVWERGCGATLACGTGACAVYAVIQRKSKIIKADYVFEEITLEFPGGNLFLSENREGYIILRGSATFVFKGEI